MKIENCRKCGNPPRVFSGNDDRINITIECCGNSVSLGPYYSYDCGQMMQTDYFEEAVEIWNQKCGVKTNSKE